MRRAARAGAAARRSARRGRRGASPACAAAYLRLAAAAAAARLALFTTLPGLPGAPLDAPAPPPLAALLKEANALAAERSDLAREVEPDTPDSRALLSLLPARCDSARCRASTTTPTSALQTLCGALAAGAAVWRRPPPTPPPAELEAALGEPGAWSRGTATR